MTHSATNGHLEPLSLCPITAPNNGPQSPAQVKCEEQAAQQYQNTLNDAGKAFTVQGMIKAGATGGLTGGLGGCIAGALHDFWLGPEIAGPACVAVGLPAGLIGIPSGIAFDQISSITEALAARSITANR